MTGATEGSGRGLLEWRDWRSGRQWKGDCWTGVTGAVEGSGRGLLEWRDWRNGRQSKGTVGVA